MKTSEHPRVSARNDGSGRVIVCPGSEGGRRDRLGSGLLLKALCRAVQAAVAAYGEALKSRDHPRPQDNDGTTSKDPLVDLLKRFEAASKK
jgi:hypothetical protein